MYEFFLGFRNINRDEPREYHPLPRNKLGCIVQNLVQISYQCYVQNMHVTNSANTKMFVYAVGEDTELSFVARFENKENCRRREDSNIHGERRAERGHCVCCVCLRG